MKVLSILFFLVLMAVSLPVVADVSFEAGVNVATEAENASLAKDEAMKKANREAFLNVASRLTTEDNVQKLNELTDEQLLHFIREVYVVSEHSGTTTYRADLNIKINEKLLKQYMQENNMLEVVAAPAKILIIPVYSDTAYPDKVVWEDGNLWRKAWLDKGLIKSGAYDFLVIADTQGNRSAFPAGRLDKTAYDKLLFINHVKDIFTVNAVRAGRNTLVVVVRTYPETNEKRLLITDENGDTFDKAIAATVGYITAEMEGKNLQENSRQGSLDIVYRFDKLPDWFAAEKRLNKIPQIKSVQTTAIGNHQVKIRVEFSGSESRLRSSLENSGLYLQSNNGQYFLR